MRTHYENLSFEIRKRLNNNTKPDISLNDWKFIMGKLNRFERLFNYLNDRALAIGPTENMEEEERHDRRIAYQTLHEVLEIMVDIDEEADKHEY